MGVLRKRVALAALFFLLGGTAAAGPWAMPGDAGLRSDIEILAAAGVIDNITMQWPLPWAGVLYRLDDPEALAGQPDYVRDAALRVEARARAETRKDEMRASVTADAASAPNVVRGFDALGRQRIQGQASAGYLWTTTAVHVALGAQTVSNFDHQVFMADDSYLAQRLGNAVVYAGYMPHWWGPGWISAMQLSTNARPVPQIGIARVGTRPFDWPVLRWLGPWQMEFFVGVLDGPRSARNTIYNGFRFDFSPVPHLEIGLARTDEMCGSGHPCSPFKGYFNLLNDTNKANIVNDEGSIDIRYSGAFSGLAYEVYTQAMNEDTNPIQHSATSHLFGASVWTPVYGGMARLTAEYADSYATRDIWGSGIIHGGAYNNYSYTDGMRYRARTLGFSLDNGSRLFSVQASWSDRTSDSFTFTYHHAEISDALAPGGNFVSSLPVTINQVQGRVSLPFRVGDHGLRLDVEARYQDDQPRPDKGSLATVEARLSFDL